MAVTLIAHTEVGAGGAANITFSSIASTFDDLWLLVSGRSTTASTAIILGVQMNTDTATTNYSRTTLIGQSSGTVSSGRYTGGTFNYVALNSVSGSTSTANTFASISAYIPNYKNTSTFKSLIGDAANENNSTADYTLSLNAGLWRSTSAINQLVVFPGSGNFVQYSQATLYGVTKA